MALPYFERRRHRRGGQNAKVAVEKIHIYKGGDMAEPVEGNGASESRRKMKVRDDIEKQITALEDMAAEMRETMDDIESACKTLKWVIGDGDLPPEALTIERYHAR
jgi:hypothetical protein